MHRFRGVAGSSPWCSLSRTEKDDVGSTAVVDKGDANTGRASAGWREIERQTPLLAMGGEGGFGEKELRWMLDCGYDDTPVQVTAWLQADGNAALGRIGPCCA